MEEEKESVEAPVATLEFVEVLCTSSGKVRRFARGVTAGFAISVICLKLEPGAPGCLYIEAIKEGEESISFGPNSVLVIHGDGWKLQTVVESKGFRGIADIPGGAVNADMKGFNPLVSGRKASPQPGVPPFYIGKIVLAFIFIFLLAGFFSLALENLPQLLLFINPSV
ncbi:hypothetical protein Droror1_Dr00011977 [Drosera rotundifolia]